MIAFTMSTDISTYRQRIGCFSSLSSLNFTKNRCFRGSSLTLVSSPSLFVIVCSFGLFTATCYAFLQCPSQQSSSISCFGKYNCSSCNLRNIGHKVDYNFLAKYKYGNREKGGMKIMHWNVGGGFLKNKLPEIESDISKHRPHIFGILEACFKKEHDLSDIRIDNYEV